VAEYKPTSGSSFIKTPKYIADKHAVINVNNSDNKCFIWAILSALHPTNKDPQRVTKYQQHENTLDTTGLTFPLAVSDVKKFEKLNKAISVNVFAYDDKTEVYPVYISKNKDRQHNINLLMLTSDDNFHYTWIKNMSRLLREKGQTHGEKFFCKYCLHGFYEERVLNRHVEDCSKLGAQKVNIDYKRLKRFL
jgi:hypothetical protein